MKPRMTTVLLLALAALAPAGADAQEQRAAACPTVVVSCPDNPYAAKTVTYTAVAKGATRRSRRPISGPCRAGR